MNTYKVLMLLENICTISLIQFIVFIILFLGACKYFLYFHRVNEFIFPISPEVFRLVNFIRNILSCWFSGTCLLKLSGILEQRVDRFVGQLQNCFSQSPQGEKEDNCRAVPEKWDLTGSNSQMPIPRNCLLIWPKFKGDTAKQSV